MNVKPGLADAVQLALQPLATDVGVEVTERPTSGLAVPVSVRLPTATNVALTVQFAATMLVV